MTTNCLLTLVPSSQGEICACSREICMVGFLSGLGFFLLIYTLLCIYVKGHMVEEMSPAGTEWGEFFGSLYSCRTGAGKIRPPGQIQPTRHFHLAHGDHQQIVPHPGLPPTRVGTRCPHIHMPPTNIPYFISLVSSWVERPDLLSMQLPTRAAAATTWPPWCPACSQQQVGKQ